MVFFLKKTTKPASMKPEGISDFVLKARGKLAVMMHVTNAEICSES